jgi:hypothetical protein
MPKRYVANWVLLLETLLKPAVVTKSYGLLSACQEYGLRGGKLSYSITRQICKMTRMEGVRKPLKIQKIRKDS